MPNNIRISPLKQINTTNADNYLSSKILFALHIYRRRFVKLISLLRAVPTLTHYRTIIFIRRLPFDEAYDSGRIDRLLAFEGPAHDCPKTRPEFAGLVTGGAAH